MAADINALLASGIGGALVEGSHAGYYAGRGRLEQQQEEQKQQSAQYIPGAIKGDPQALAQLATANAPAANAVGLALSRMDANQRAKAKDTADWVSRASNAVLQADPKDQPAMYERMKAEGLALGHDVSKLGPWDQSTPSMLRYQRGMSQDVLKHDLQMELKKTPPGKNAGGGGSGEVWGAPGPQSSAAPTASPVTAADAGPAAPPVQAASYLPPNLQPQSAFTKPDANMNVAPPGSEVPQGEPIVLPSTSIPISQTAQAGPPGPSPTAPVGPPEGFQAMGHRDAKGQLVPAQINGQPVYRNPQTGEMRLGDAPPVQTAAAPAEPVPALSSGGTNAQGPGGGLPPGVQTAELGDRYSPKIVFENPGERGGVYGTKPGAHGNRDVITGPGGGTLFKMPDGKFEEYKPELKPPKPEKPMGPAGPFAGQGIEGQFGNILQQGNLPQGKTDTPEYALAYQHFAKPHTTVDEQGKPITIPGMDMSVFKKPTFNANPDADSIPKATVGAPIPGAAKLHPIPASENDKIAAGVSLITSVDKALQSYKGEGVPTSGRGAGFISRNLGQTGDLIAQEIDPSGVKARALIADITSQVMLARSGAAVTEGEAKRLMGMIPSPADKPQTIVDKLQQIRDTYAGILKSQTAQYTPQRGFAPHEGAQKILNPSAPQGGGGDVPVMTPEQVRAAPPGTKYKTTDGREGVRP